MTEPTEAQIEAAAEACYAAFSLNRVAGWDDIAEEDRDGYRRDAREIIAGVLTAASRTEPTEATIDAGAKALLLDWQGADTEVLFEEPIWRDSYRNGARAVLTAALAVAPMTPDDDDLAGLEPTLVYQTDTVALYAYPVAESVLLVEQRDNGPSHRLFIPAMYCDAMIEALLVGKPEREKRLAFLRETFPAADSLERAAAEIEAKGCLWNVGKGYPGYVFQGFVEVETHPGFWVGFAGGGDTPLLALRAAMTAADGRED